MGEWFWEQYVVTGYWSPRKGPKPPEPRSSEGRELKLRKVRQLEPDEQGKSLSELQSKYGGLG